MKTFWIPKYIVSCKYTAKHTGWFPSPAKILETCQCKRVCLCLCGSKTMQNAMLTSATNPTHSKTRGYMNAHSPCKASALLAIYIYVYIYAWHCGDKSRYHVFFLSMYNPFLLGVHMPCIPSSSSSSSSIMKQSPSRPHNQSISISIANFVCFDLPVTPPKCKNVLPPECVLKRKS